jgi:hypothetical protein
MADAKPLPWENRGMSPSPEQHVGNLSLPTRFFLAFINRFTMPIKHHCVHGILAVAAIGIDVRRFGWSWTAVKNHVWDEIFPLAVAVSIAVAWHSVTAANELIATIRAQSRNQSDREASVLTSRGEKFRIPALPPAPPYLFRIKIWAAAGLTVFVFLAVPALVWKFAIPSEATSVKDVRTEDRSSSPIPTPPKFGADLTAKIDTSPAFAYIPDSNSTVVAFIATVTNVRYSPQTVVTNWTFDIVDRHGNRKGANAVQIPKSMFPDSWIVFPDLSQHQNHPGWVFFLDEYLPDKTDSPIAQGDHKSGCLFFQLHDTNIADVAIDGAPYHLIWVGSDGRIFYIEGRLNFEADSLMQTVAGLRSGFNWGHAPINVQGLPHKNVHRRRQ